MDAFWSQRHHQTFSMVYGLSFGFFYLDDIFIAGSSAEHHMFHLCQVFQCLTMHGLTVNPANCQFGLSVIDFFWAIEFPGACRS